MQRRPPPSYSLRDNEAVKEAIARFRLIPKIAEKEYDPMVKQQYPEGDVACFFKAMQGLYLPSNLERHLRDDNGAMSQTQAKALINKEGTLEIGEHGLYKNAELVFPWTSDASQNITFSDAQELVSPHRKDTGRRANKGSGKRETDEETGTGMQKGRPGQGRMRDDNRSTKYDSENHEKVARGWDHPDGSRPDSTGYQCFAIPGVNANDGKLIQYLVYHDVEEEAGFGWVANLNGSAYLKISPDIHKALSMAVEVPSVAVVPLKGKGEEKRKGKQSDFDRTITKLKEAVDGRMYDRALTFSKGNRADAIKKERKQQLEDFDSDLKNPKIEVDKAFKEVKDGESKIVQTKKKSGAEKRGGVEKRGRLTTKDDST